MNHQSLIGAVRRDRRIIELTDPGQLGRPDGIKIHITRLGGDREGDSQHVAGGNLIGVVILKDRGAVGGADSDPMGQGCDAHAEIRLQRELIGRGPTGTAHRQVVALAPWQQRREVVVEGTGEDAPGRHARHQRHRIGLHGIRQARVAVEQRQRTPGEVDERIGGAFRLERYVDHEVPDILTHDVGGEGHAVGQPEGRRIGGHEGETQLPVEQQARLTAPGVRGLELPRSGARLPHQRT